MCARLLGTANHSMDGVAWETGMEPLICEIQVKAEPVQSDGPLVGYEALAS